MQDALTGNSAAINGCVNFAGRPGSGDIIDQHFLTMTEIINEAISAILQVIAFSLIPFAAFLFRKNKAVTFFTYIGLYHPTRKSVRYAVVTSLLFVLAGVTMIFLDAGVREIVINPPSVTGKIRAVEATGIALALIAIIAVVKTSLAEEILFRGFIARRLISLWGYTAGNVVQSLIFGLVHLVLFWKLMNPTILAVAFIFVLSTLAGWVIGMIKEKYAHGSIVPGWIAHALGNTISYSIIVFLV